MSITPVRHYLGPCRPCLCEVWGQTGLPRLACPYPTGTHTWCVERGVTTYTQTHVRAHIGTARPEAPRGACVALCAVLPPPGPPVLGGGRGLTRGEHLHRTHAPGGWWGGSLYRGLPRPLSPTGQKPIESGPWRQTLTTHTA